MQTPRVIVQRNTTVLFGTSEVIVLVGEAGLVMFPGPETIDHKPVPTVGALAETVVEVAIHKV